MVQLYRSEDRETQAHPPELCEQCRHREVYNNIGGKEKRESNLKPPCQAAPGHYSASFPLAWGESQLCGSCREYSFKGSTVLPAHPNPPSVPAASLGSFAAAAVQEAFQPHMHPALCTHPQRSAAQGSLKDLINSVPLAGSADHHTGRAISKWECEHTALP